VKRSELQEAFLQGDLHTLPETIHQKKGCPKCNGTGYSGRTGIYEIMEWNDELTEAVNRKAELTTIREIAARRGMRTLRESALDLCARGRTTVEEVIRVTAE
jgi:type II secretory ATPase GspE/PulE/Tfp pilus assembly ATPase PilB-like protein